VRILHLLSYPLYSGPVPQTIGLARAQRQLGHQAWLAIDGKRGAFNPYEEAADAGDLGAPWQLTLSTKSSPVEYLRDLRTLRAIAGSGEVDVLHVHMSHDHGLAALAGTGRTVRVRTFHADRSLVRRFGQALLNSRADAWITRCEAHRQLLLSRFSVTEEHTWVIPGSIDGEHFAPADAPARAAARRRFRLPEDATVVGQAALIAGRGQEELVESLLHLGDGAPHVLFAGRGEQESALRARVAAAGLEERVRFAGYLAGSDLAAAYAAMDIAFVAQPGNDASARAALEAMASGVPLVAVRTGSLGELVHPGVGHSIRSRMPLDIAGGLQAVLADRSAAAARADRARELVLAERTFAREAEATLALYEAVARR
jgi:glycosyltransferase involved in cell wall biosynthesis